MTEKRCAVYTRKSTEEGLEQEFNSLDAQREACEAYIKSQAHEGWKLVRKKYNDGGFSGGNLKRPALQQLLQDIEDDKVDVIVVYKIDRLTRSLMDFSKMIEVLDTNEASFAAVTQHFNTTTSMGRLTLNVLLSFAQFEREITGERIRDKIAASKKKGMWTGGPRPLGYDIVERKLVANEAEAKIVRIIFERYLALGSVADAIQELHQKGITNKTWKSANGKRRGGNRFHPGPVYKILQNHLYAGKIRFKGEVYDGEHERIISPELWDAVQAQLEKNRKIHAAAKLRKTPALVEGIIYDSKGHTMTPTYSTKKGNQRYPYYVSAPIIGRRRVAVGDLSRVPARPLEELIRNRIGTIMNLEPHFIEFNIVKRVLKRVTVYSDFIELEADHGIPNADTHRLHGNGDDIVRSESNVIIRIQAILRMRDRQLTFVNQNGYDVMKPETPNRVLVKNLAVSHRWRIRLESGESGSIRELARAEKCSEKFVRKILPLAYLAPDIVESILDGKQPPSLDLQHFTTSKLPLCWAAQRKLLGYTA